jgi:hypothetical protein
MGANIEGQLRSRQLRALAAPIDRDSTGLGVAAQEPVPSAIAVSHMTTAKGSLRTVIELVVDATMPRAISTAAEGIKATMVAEPRRKLLRALPIPPSK